MNLPQAGDQLVPNAPNYSRAKLHTPFISLIFVN